MVDGCCTVSPPMTSILLRDCWSTGPVKDRFPHYEKSGHQCVGITITGLSVLSTDFTVSLAYYDIGGR